MKTKILFIYSDIILIEDIPSAYTLDKGIFYPGTITYLKLISIDLDYYLVVITNQIDFGTETYPKVIFYKPHKFILRTFEGECIYLSSIYRANFKEASDTGIGMLFSYFSKTYDCNQSFVIGDRIILFLKTEGEGLTKEEVALHTSSKSRWKKIYNLLKFYFSECSYRRRSKETDIQIFIKIDGKGISKNHTGFGFLDHVLDQICIHANIDLGLKVKGDVHVDEHHTIEDTAITIGIALSKFLKDKRGITRYGFLLPMDDVLVQIVLDLGGRSNLVWKVDLEREKIGDVPTEMFVHFFKSFSDVAYCNLNIQAEGNNEHHKIEAIFKAFACTIKMAISREHLDDRVPSTKEIL